MIDRHSLLALNFYKKSPFTGSDGNMRYRVEKIEFPIPDTKMKKKSNCKPPSGRDLSPLLRRTKKK